MVSEAEKEMFVIDARPWDIEAQIAKDRADQNAQWAEEDRERASMLEGIATGRYVGLAFNLSALRDAGRIIKNETLAVFLVLEWDGERGKGEMR